MTETEKTLIAATHAYVANSTQENRDALTEAQRRRDEEKELTDGPEQ